jgi:hypothetical protein
MLPYKVHYTNTHNGRQPWGARLPNSTTIATAELELGLFVPELQHPATTLNDYVNN